IRRDYTRTIAQLRSQLERSACGLALVKKHAHVDFSVWSKHIRGPCKNVFDEDFRHDAQVHVTVNSAEREVINLAAKRRNVFSFRRMNLDRENVVALPVEVRR